MRADGAPVERLTDATPARWSPSSFPTGSSSCSARPRCGARTSTRSSRRCGPARAGTRRAYSAALAQRNALIAGIRAGRAGRGSLPAWDAELARHGVALMADRARGVDRLGRASPCMRRRSASTASAELAYRPRSKAATAEELAAELAERPRATSSAASPATGRTATISRSAATGATCARTGRAGQQRLALLALLLAEREELEPRRGRRR